MILTMRLILVFLLASVSLYAFADANQPEPRQKNFDWMPLHSWYEFHAEDVKLAWQGDADLLFLGDSITQGWDQTLWQEYFAPYNAVNFGIGGDLTQNLLWRLQNGAIGNLQPRLIVLMIGVNNFGHENASAEEVHEGVAAIIEELHSRMPASKIILSGILPYGEKSEVSNRQRVRDANNMLKQLAEKQGLIFRDYGHLFLQEDGSIPRDLMPDLLHPNAYGYALIADHLVPLVKQLLPPNPLVPAANEHIQIEGRSHIDMQQQLLIGYPGVSLHTRYQGEALAMRASSSNGNNLVDIFIDGKFSKTIRVGKQTSNYLLFHSRQVSDVRIELVHRSETWHGVLGIEGFKLYGGKLAPAEALPERKLLFIGDSVTCGEALVREKTCNKNFSWWDPQHSYGKLLGEMLNAQTHLVCYGGRGLLRSWNGKTDELQAPDFFQASVALENNPPLWEHNRYNPDLIFISLGTNDFNLNIGPFPDRENYVDRYLEFIDNLRQQHPNAKIVITEGAIVNDKSDRARPQKTVLQSYLQEVQQRSGADVTYLPSRVYPGDKCDAHPTAKQHKKIAKDFKPVLEKLMGW